MTTPVPFVAFITVAPDDVIAYYVRSFDLHLFYRLPVLCQRTREHFQLARRLALAEAIGGNVVITTRTGAIHSIIRWRLARPWPRYPSAMVMVSHSFFGPAITYADGVRVWYWSGEIHRGGDLPALIADRELVWYRHGAIHRDNAPSGTVRPAVISWTYAPDYHVSICMYKNGEYIATHGQRFNSDDAVDHCVDQLAGVDWRE